MEVISLELNTFNLEEQKKFYNNLLGFKLVGEQVDTFTIQAGESKLIFKQSNSKTFYHFAFLIPTGALKSAITFLEQKNITLLPHKGSKIIEFNDGQAIYFYDCDGNIVEFIQRPTLPVLVDNHFKIDSVIKINEIGLPVKNPQKMAHLIMHKTGIKALAAHNFKENFCWVGDYNGAIIVVKQGRNWLPTERAAVSNDFSLTFYEEGTSQKIDFVKGQLKL